ncbi:E2/E3 hybrid ubiquitin-protein ligase ube2o [Dinochytrium kinnereticum]|nr:E2/E3 hybrid ubiquitin-protein ligase ube2o [Dinochytrium kinnereticum]
MSPDAKKRPKFFFGDTIATKSPFTEDEYLSIVGVVEQTHWDEPEDDDEEDEDEVETTHVEVPEGKLLVSMVKNESNSTLMDESGVILLNRTPDLALAIVKYVDKSMTSQSGVVVEIRVEVDLHHAKSGKTVAKVDTKLLELPQPIMESNFAHKDDWVGTIKHIWDQVIVQFEDGSICGFQNYDELEEAIEEDSVDDFYPGRLLNPITKENLKAGMWIKGAYQEKYCHEKSVVNQVKPERVQVEWKLYNSLKDRDEIETPPDIVNVADIQVVQSSLEESFFQLCDKVVFKNLSDYKVHFDFEADEHSLIDNIMSVCRAKTFVSVQWQDGTITKDIEATSLFPCHHIDEQELWPYDFVVMGSGESDEAKVTAGQVGLVTKVDASSRTAHVRWFDDKMDAIDDVQEEPKEYSLYEITLHPEMNFERGDIVIITEDPHASSDLKLGENECDDDPLYEDEDEDEYEDEDEDEDVEEDSQVVIGGEEIDTNVDDHESESGWETEEECHDVMLDVIPAADDLKHPRSVEKISFSWTPKNSQKNEEEVDGDAWMAFAVCEETPASHHFILNNTAISKSLSKRIRSEHSILSTSLPSGILVRAFEDRLDLLRIVMVGPEGTPYEKGLFMFDLSFPSDYPQSPPNVFFHSWTFGMGRLNPNLYEGLVLNRDPYYNEAGYEKQVGTEEGALNSILYTEKAFLLTLKSVSHIIANPPEPFREEVSHHFFKQGELRRLCERCDKLEKLQGDETTKPDNFPLGKVSTGCLKMMKGLRLKLEILLAKNESGDTPGP